MNLAHQRMRLVRNGLGKVPLCDVKDVQQGARRRLISAGIVGSNMSCQSSSRGYLEAGVSLTVLTLTAESHALFDSATLGGY